MWFLQHRTGNNSVPESTIEKRAKLQSVMPRWYCLKWFHGQKDQEESTFVEHNNVFQSLGNSDFIVCVQSCQLLSNWHCVYRLHYKFKNRDLPKGFPLTLNASGFMSIWRLQVIWIFWYSAEIQRKWYFDAHRFSPNQQWAKLAWKSVQ